MDNWLDAAAADSGTSDVKIALVGLGGALIGALVGFVGVWIQTRHSALMADRAELRRSYETFMVARDADRVAFKRWNQVSAMPGDYDSNGPEFDKATDEVVASGDALLRAQAALHIQAPSDTSECAIIMMNADEMADYLQMQTRMLFFAMMRRDTASTSRVRSEARRTVKTIQREPWYEEARKYQGSLLNDIAPVPWNTFREVRNP
jgi:hypothetical protein